MNGFSIQSGLKHREKNPSNSIKDLSRCPNLSWNSSSFRVVPAKPLHQSNSFPKTDTETPSHRPIVHRLHLVSGNWFRFTHINPYQIIFQLYLSATRQHIFRKSRHQRSPKKNPSMNEWSLAVRAWANGLFRFVWKKPTADKKLWMNRSQEKEEKGRLTWRLHARPGDHRPNRSFWKQKNLLRTYR